MRTSLFRKTHQPQIVNFFPSKDIINLFDHKLQYLNDSFNTNLRFHEIYMDLIKQKKQLRVKDIKQLYLIFTVNKAESLMFGHQIQNKIDGFQQIDQNISTLKRVYARLIEKIIVKISYYFMNKSSLRFTFKNISQIAKKCQIFTRRLHNVRDFSYLNQIIDNIYHQNQLIQQKILNQLVNKGYLHSIDQFYRINGIDQECQESYKCKQSDPLDENESFKKQNKTKNSVKFITNLAKNSVKNIRISPNSSNFKLSKHTNFTQSQCQIENRFRKIISELSQIFSDEERQNQNDQKTQQQRQRYTKDIALLKDAILETNQQETIHQISKQEDNIYQNTEVKIHQNMQEQEIHNLTSQNQKKKKPFFNCLGQTTEENVVNLIRKQSKQITIAQFQLKNELKFQEIKIQNFLTNPQIGRSSGRSTKRSYFSKQFITAIQTIQKSNFTQKSNQLSIKLMSQHMMKYKKEVDPLVAIDKQTTKKLFPKNKRQKQESILNLLKIYKEKRERQLVKSLQRIAQDKFNAIQNDYIQGNQKRQPVQVQAEDDIFSKNIRQNKIAIKLKNPNISYNKIIKRRQHLQSQQTRTINGQKQNHQDQKGHLIDYDKFIINKSNESRISRQTEPFVHTHRNAYSKINESKQISLAPSSYPELYYCNKEFKLLNNSRDKGKVTFCNKKIKQQLLGGTTHNQITTKTKFNLDIVRNYCKKMRTNQKIDNFYIMTNNGVESAFPAIQNGYDRVSSLQRQSSNKIFSSSVVTPTRFQVYDRIRRIKI